MANKKKRVPRFQPLTQALDEQRPPSPDDDEPAPILYEPPRDAPPAAPPNDDELLYVPEPAEEPDAQLEQPESELEEAAARRRGLFDNAPERAPEPEPDVTPEVASPVVTASEPAAAAVTNAAVAMIERQVRDLRSELALFIEHASASMARIDRLLTAMHNVDATAPTEPLTAQDAAVPNVGMLPDQASAARGRGFVGGWRPQRD